MTAMADNELDPDLLNEDWTKGTWDLWNLNATPITTVEQLLAVIPARPGESDADAIAHFTELPAWRSAPDDLKQEVAALAATMSD
jgi:hypothetical protein